MLLSIRFPTKISLLFIVRLKVRILPHLTFCRCDPSPSQTIQSSQRSSPPSEGGRILDKPTKTAKNKFAHFQHFEGPNVPLFGASIHGLLSEPRQWNLSFVCLEIDGQRLVGPDKGTSLFVWFSTKIPKLCISNVCRSREIKASQWIETTRTTSRRKGRCTLGACQEMGKTEPLGEAGVSYACPDWPETLLNGVRSMEIRDTYRDPSRRFGTSSLSLRCRVPQRKSCHRCE